MTAQISEEILLFFMHIFIEHLLGICTLLPVCKYQDMFLRTHIHIGETVNEKVTATKHKCLSKNYTKNVKLAKMSEQ